MRSVEEHREACLALLPVGAPASEYVELLEAAGRVLAEDTVAPAALPGFDNSAMDGYAVRLADVAAAGEDGSGSPVVLPVVEDLPAGHGRPAPLRPGTVARIMTGAPLPDGADAIVQVEWTDAGAERVEIRRAPALHQHIRRAGDDVRAGDLVLQAGTRLAARHVALLAAVGHAQVAVTRRPRVVVLSTGSELVPPGEALGFGQLHDSNGYGLTVAAREAGAQARYAGNVADSAEGFVTALAELVGDADLVVTSGGVSAGAYDTVKEVLTASGNVEFGKVAMQPGAPQGCGKVGARGVPILTLPGNPVSALVSFEVFVRPLIRALLGEAELLPTPLTVTAATGWRSPQGRRQFVRCALETAPDGAARVRPVGGHGSHLVRALADADCLAVVEEDVVEVRAGDTLSCMLLDHLRVRPSRPGPA